MAKEDRRGRRKVIFSKDGALVVTGDGYSIQLWRTSTGELLHTLSERFPDSQQAGYGDGRISDQRR